MKLKKIVAAICAAAMTVSAVAITPLFASAEDVELKVGGVSSVTLENNPWAGDENAIANPDIALDEKWGSPVSVKGYSGLEIQYTCDNPDVIANVYLVAQKGTMPGSWYQVTDKAAATGSLLLSFVDHQDKTYEKLLVQIQPTSDFKIGDTFEPGFTVTSAKLIGMPEKVEEDGPKVLFEGAMSSGNANPSKTTVEKYDTSAVIAVTYLLAADEAAAGKPTEDGNYYAGSMAGQGKADGDFTWLQSDNEKDFFTFTADEFGTEKTFTITVADYIKQIGMNKLPNAIYVGIWNGCTLTKITIDGPLAAEKPAEEAPAPVPEAPKVSVFNSPLLPIYNVVLTSTNNATAIAKLKDGDTYEYELTAMNPVIKRRVFQSIMGKDVTIKVTYKGMTWEYNGKDITTPHTINFRTLYEKAMAEKEAE